MMLSKEKPAIFEEIKKVFKVNWDIGIAIAYGDTIYSKNDIPPDLLAHELTHINQQKELGVEKWWELYLSNKNFRLNQEMEAYKAQIEFLQNNNVGREYKRWKLNQIPKDLSSQMYGNMLSYKQAKKILGL